MLYDSRAFRAWKSQGIVVLASLSLGCLLDICAAILSFHCHVRDSLSFLSLMHVIGDYIGRDSIGVI